MLNLDYLAMEKLTQSWKHKFNKSVDHGTEVKVRWHMPGWHVPSMVNMWTKYGKLMLYSNEETTDLITKTLYEFYRASRTEKQ